MKDHPIIESVRADIEGLDFADDDKRQEAEDSIICTVQTLIDRLATAADRIASLEAERDDARRQRDEIGRAWDEADARAKEAEARAASLEKALAPFSDMAGEMFARGWDESNVAIALDNPDDPHRVTAGDFFCARRAASLSSSKQKDGGE